VCAALAAIAAGDSRWKSINVDAYLGQVATTNGFWMSFNELTGDYPWLTKRLATALAVKNGEDIEHPRRHILAWILSMFVPRFGAGGAASILVTVALIGVLAAIGIPAYQQYVQKANIAVAYEAAVTVRNQASEYIMKEEKWPGNMTDLGYSSEVIVDPAGRYEIGVYEDSVVGVNVGNDTNGEVRYVILEATVEDGELSWICYGQNLNENLLPAACQ
jgi:Tfp pilus assembly major pilin PilA